MRVQIGNKFIGDNERTFIVAEMSGNHGGSLQKALDIVSSIKRSGADAVKLQTYTADTITLKSEIEDFKLKSDSPWAEHLNLWNLYDHAHTPFEWHEEIFNHARSIGLEIFSSVFDETAVDLCESLDTPAYKIASPEINHIPLLEKVSKTKKPIIISTGVATLSDIKLALKTLENSKSGPVIILKCTTSYPAPLSEANLLTIPDIRAKFGTLVGFSDHTKGNLASIVAASLGANLIEKHFNLDEVGKTVDSFFSANEYEFSKLVNDIREVELIKGKVDYELSSSALQNINGRRSIYVKAPIKKGEKFSSANLAVIRPGFSLAPEFYKDIVGRVCKNDLGVGQRISWECIE